MVRNRLTPPLTLLVMLLLGVTAAPASAQTGTLEYESGWFVHSAEITGGPANTRFQLQSRKAGEGFQDMEWRGPTRTDADGDWSGWNVNQGIGPLPGHKEVRACWLDANGEETGQYTQITEPTMARENTSFDNAALIPLSLGASEPVSVDFTLFQNTQSCDAELPLGWLLDGSIVQLGLTDAFTWMDVDVQSTNPGALQIQDVLVHPDDPHMLLIQLGGNTRTDPFVGLAVSAQVMYDGTGGADAARPSIFMAGDFDVEDIGPQQVLGNAVLFNVNRCDPADVNGNGVVDFDDIIAVLSKWGPCK